MLKKLVAKDSNRVQLLTDVTYIPSNEIAASKIAVFRWQNDL